jgi:hypothetical protein
MYSFDSISPLFAVCCIFLGAASQPSPQISIPLVDRMPELPTPLVATNWSELTQIYINTAFDATQQVCEEVKIVFVNYFRENSCL